MTTPTFGNKASGRLPKREDGLGGSLLANAKPRTVGPLICRLCKSIGQHVQVRVRNIDGTGFRAFPCCEDRDACRAEREAQGKDWPLIDASRPLFSPSPEEGS